MKSHRTPKTSFWCVILLLSFLLCTGCAHLPFREKPAPLPEILTQNRGWSGFRRPTENQDAKLTMLKPYQPGKIPVVFIHGLLSGPQTWKEMITELQADPDLAERYQFWVYQYPTGQSFLESGAELRKQLRQTISKFTPYGTDPALSQMVLIGHSMGGLLAKLQVTHSDRQLWQSVSDAPFESLEAEPNTHRKIQEALFFEPQPFVSRVIFIATPHRGSPWTERTPGKLARKLVKFPKTLREDYRNLIANNGTLFTSENLESPPTSVNHLSQANPLIQAANRLRLAEGVRVHSIAGTSKRLPDRSIGDGVVSLDSTQLPSADSELLVPASHTKIHQHPAAIGEVKRLLR